MTLFRPSALLLAAVLLAPAPAFAASAEAIAKGLAPHKALYNIRLVATHSGSQIIDVSGQMVYEWKPTCDGWLTDHRFKLLYEYADSPGMKITSDFSTFETFDGKDFSYSSRRQKDGEVYQEIRGHADAEANGGKANYTIPEEIKYDLAKGTLFPMGHTLELIKHAEEGKKFYSAQIFDGSDEDGPIEINSFIGKKQAPSKESLSNPQIDKSLIDGKAWNVRMAVFPTKDQEEESDYEMSMLFHENGIISDMLIEYDDFSVKQTLVALEKLPADTCEGGKIEIPKKP